MRVDNRSHDELRTVKITPDFVQCAEASYLIEVGRTRVLCNASLTTDVPKWMKDEPKGWITAEYSLLPRSTDSRVRRERSGASGRTQEIQRLIGRSLRAVANLEAMPGVSVTVDCDVIEADGGTRTASIVGLMPSVLAFSRTIFTLSGCDRAFCIHPDVPKSMSIFSVPTEIRDLFVEISKCPLLF